MLSIVIPSYNEGDHIFNNLNIISEEISKFTDDFELVPVNDGSKDNTGSEILRAASVNSKISPVVYEKNKGKGAAIVEGVKHSKGDIIGFLDADLDISPSHVASYISAMNEKNADVVIGSKMHKDSKLDYPPMRRFFSWGYFVLLKILFGLKVKDTQTGIKFYKAEFIKNIVDKLTVYGYAFDIEILALANSMKASIIEMPVEIVFQRGESFGRIKVSDIWKMFTDTVGIWWRLRIKKSY